MQKYYNPEEAGNIFNNRTEIFNYYENSREKISFPEEMFSLNKNGT